MVLDLLLGMWVSHQTFPLPLLWKDLFWYNIGYKFFCRVNSHMFDNRGVSKFFLDIRKYWRTQAKLHTSLSCMQYLKLTELVHIRCCQKLKRMLKVYDFLILAFTENCFFQFQRQQFFVFNWKRSNFHYS